MNLQHTHMNLFKLTSAWIPMLMSLLALLLLLGWVLFNGTAGSTSGDESGAAHLFQLLLFGQLPIVVWFLFNWIAKKPRRTLLVLLAQGICWLVPFITVILLER